MHREFIGGAIASGLAATGMNLVVADCVEESAASEVKALIEVGGKTVFNPFAIREVRFALNFLMNRKYIVDEITGGVDVLYFGRAEVNPRAYLSWFNLRGADQQKKVGVMSGGERNRLHLAKLLKAGGNVMLLDEPTNDLDVNTLRALEEALEGFAGCAVVISHDRWFLDRIATHIIAFEGDSRVVWFEGNYSEYEADRRKRLGAEADQPHRIKYRALTR